eukprot:gene4245-4953_t
MASYLMMDLFLRSFNVREHYSQWGQYPTSMSLSDNRISFHQVSGTVPFQLGLMLIAAAFAMSMLIGYRTRLSTIMSYVFLCSLQNRNQFVLDGSDDYCRRESHLNLWNQEYKQNQTTVKTFHNNTNSKQTINNNSNNNYNNNQINIYHLEPLDTVFNSPNGEEWHVTYDAVHYSLNLIEFTHGIADTLLQFPSLLRYMTRSISWMIFSVVIPLLLIIYIPYWNYVGATKTETSSPPILYGVAQLIKVDQWWGMFAPNPPKQSRWLSIPAEFENYQGELLNETPIADYYSKPLYAFRVGQRQRNFIMAVMFQEELRLGYGRYLCRKNNIYEPNAGYGQLKHFKIIVVTRNTPGVGEEDKHDYRLDEIWNHTC